MTTRHREHTEGEPILTTETRQRLAAIAEEIGLGLLTLDDVKKAIEATLACKIAVDEKFDAQMLVAGMSGWLSGCSADAREQREAEAKKGGR